MKQMTSYNRIAGYLNKIFDLINEAFFEVHFQYRPSPSRVHREPTGISLCERIPEFPNWAELMKPTSAVWIVG